MQDGVATADPRLAHTNLFVNDTSHAFSIYFSGAVFDVDPTTTAQYTIYARAAITYAGKQLMHTCVYTYMCLFIYLHLLIFLF